MVNNKNILDRHNKKLANLHTKLFTAIQDYINEGEFNLAAVVGVLEALKLGVINVGNIALSKEAELKKQKKSDYIG